MLHSLCINGFFQNLSFNAIIAIVAVIYGLIKGLHFVFQRKLARDQYYYNIIDQLSSNNSTTQLSAAIRLRVVLENDNKSYKKIKKHIIKVFSSMLRVLPVGILQKTIGDGLIYACDLSGIDLQKTNLQDLCIQLKKNSTENNNAVIEFDNINFDRTDFFQSDLSFSTIKHASFNNAQFYNAILYKTRFTECEFDNTNFTDADLTGVYFNKCKMKNVCFKNAENIPIEIKEHLDKEGCYTDGYVTTTEEEKKKKVFISMAGSLSKEDSFITEIYHSLLKKKGYNVKYYTQDHYPKYGQLGKVRSELEQSDGMIVFGLKQIHIEKGQYRPNLAGQKELKDFWLPTPWNDIEMGMAVMRSIPILIVKDDEVQMGSFDSILSECWIKTISTNLDVKEIETNTCFCEWLSKIK